MQPINVTLLGQFSLNRPTQPAATFESDKVRALLAYLLAEPGKHRRDMLADLIWPDKLQARNNLKQALANLRKGLGDRSTQSKQPIILANRLAIEINPLAPISSDLQQLENIWRGINNHQHADRSRCTICQLQLEKSLEFNTGPFLSDIVLSDCPRFENWRMSKIELYRGRYVQALHDLIDLAIRRRDFAKAESYSRHILTAEPWNELAHHTLMKLEAWRGNEAAALKHYSRCEVVLAEELNIEPSNEIKTTRQLIEVGQLPSATNSQPTDPHFPITSSNFIGRESEMRQALETLSLSECRLLTIVGTGGSGKTRLAAHMAHAASGNYENGVYFVQLRDIDDPAFLPLAIAGVLQLSFHDQNPAADQLIDYLRSRQVLLVLDNCEQLLEAAEHITQLINRTRRLKILATSRHRLQILNEWIFDLGGMNPETRDPQRLFQASAARFRPSLRFSADQAPLIEAICKSVNYLPLGIELASVWARSLTLSEIKQRIDDRESWLVKSLEQTSMGVELHEAIARSWRLLGPDTKQGLFDLSILRSDFSAEMAIAITSKPADLLGDLVEHSLVMRNQEGRFIMHELVRQLSAKEGARSPQQQSNAKKRAAAFVVSIIERNRYQLSHGHQSEAEEVLLPELSHIRQAWSIVLTAEQFDTHQASSIGYGIWRIYEYLQQPITGISLLQSGLEYCEHHQPENYDLAAKLHLWIGRLRQTLRQYPKAEKAIDKSIEAAQKSGQPSILALATLSKGLGFLYAGKLDQSGLALEQAYTFYATSSDDIGGRAWARRGMGIIAIEKNRLADAQEILEENLAQFEQLQHPRGILAANNALGELLVKKGELVSAQHHFESAVDIAQQLGYKRGLAWGLICLGQVAERHGRFEHARHEYQRSIELKNLFFETIARHRLGIVLIYEEKYSEAQQTLLKTLQLCEERQDSLMQANCYTGLGQLYMAQDKYFAAADALQNGIYLLNAFDAHRNTDQQLYSQTLLAIAMLGCQNPAAAEQTLRSVAEQLLKRDYFHGINTVLFALARLKHSTGDHEIEHTVQQTLPAAIQTLLPHGSSVAGSIPLRLTSVQPASYRLTAETKRLLTQWLSS